MVCVQLWLPVIQAGILFRYRKCPNLDLHFAVLHTWRKQCHIHDKKS